MDRLEEELASYAQGIDIALAAFGVGKGSAKMAEEEVRKIETPIPGLLPRRQSWRRSCVRGYDGGGRQSYGKGEVPENPRRQGDGCRISQVRLLGTVPSLRDCRQLQHARRTWYVMPLLHWAMPAKYHSIHKNELACAMVAQSEQAFLAIALGNAPKQAITKILEYKEMEPFFVRGKSHERLS